MKLLRIREVIDATGLSRMTIYRLERNGQFPKRRQLGENSVAWLDEDLKQWMTTRPVIANSAVPAEPGTVSTRGRLFR